MCRTACCFNLCSPWSTMGQMEDVDFLRTKTYCQDMQPSVMPMAQFRGCITARLKQMFGIYPFIKFVCCFPARKLRVSRWKWKQMQIKDKNGFWKHDLDVSLNLKHQHQTNLNRLHQQAFLNARSLSENKNLPTRGQGTGRASLASFCKEHCKGNDLLTEHSN